MLDQVKIGTNVVGPTRAIIHRLNLIYIDTTNPIAKIN
ncbi:hypothetical protein C723_2398 [Christiangramia flava JLT2011]|nr:hypothetical protein C723_2398 [Christiangramia flava JLT2011]